MSADIAPFRKRDFEVTMEIVELDPKHEAEFADAICRAKPSRLDNVIEIEVTHRADHNTHQVIQAACDRGVRRLVLRTRHPVPGPIQADPHSYMQFEYQEGRLVDQHTEMSRRDQDGDELMVDVLKLSFEKKIVTNSVWCWNRHK